MTAYADLEIALHRHDASSYIVEMRFSQPDSDADIRLVRNTGDPALALLFTSENILFPRYLSRLDWRPVRLRPQAELSALIAIANPMTRTNLE